MTNLNYIFIIIEYDLIWSNKNIYFYEKLKNVFTEV